MPREPSSVRSSFTRMERHRSSISWETAAPPAELVSAAVGEASGAAAGSAAASAAEAAAAAPSAPDGAADGAAASSTGGASPRSRACTSRSTSSSLSKASAASTPSASSSRLISLARRLPTSSRISASPAAARSTKRRALAAAPSRAVLPAKQRREGSAVRVAARAHTPANTARPASRRLRPDPGRGLWRARGLAGAGDISGRLATGTIPSNPPQACPAWSPRAKMA
mmetsp:Transcript_17439/g.52685  ORF Transcript_17439/g.52685 Transcript_17439/m.52685 type:complete len:227 (-) Transcript_17439:3-683(-)